MVKSLLVINADTAGSRLLYLLCLDLFGNEIQIDFVDYYKRDDLPLIQEYNSKLIISNDYRALVHLKQAEILSKLVYVQVDKGSVRGARGVSDESIYLDVTRPLAVFKDELQEVINRL